MTVKTVTEPASTVFRTLLGHAERDADRPALVGADGSWTYGALCDDAAAVAGGLLGRGLHPGDRYAVVAGNHASVCVAWLAGARSGLVPVLLNSLLTVPELEVAIRHVDPRLVITDCAHLDTVSGALHGAGARPMVLLDGAGPGIQPFGELRTEFPCRVPLPDADEVFEITLTSGTTSAPKAVALTHGAEARHWSAVARVLGLNAADVVKIVAPLFHSSGIRNGAMLMWSAGGSVDVGPRFSASGFWRDAAVSGATWSCLVETMVVLLAKKPDDGVRHGLRFVIGGGPPDLLDEFERRFGVRVVQGYGMTECGFPVITPPSVELSEVRSRRRFQPGALLAGRPVEGCDVRVMSAGLDVSDGQAGEIWVRSSQLLAEYVGDPTATAAALSDGWLRTGDRGVIGPHGDLYFLGRLRDVIRRGGENVASNEVEHVI